MDNLYILTAFVSAVTAFCFLFARSKLKISSNMGVFLASGFGAICLLPALFRIDYSGFGRDFYIYVIIAGIGRLISTVIMLEAVKKTSVERLSAVNPMNIFISFLVFSVIDFSNTLNLIQNPVKFMGILGSIIGIVSVLIISKKDKNFMETFKIMLPAFLVISLSSSFMRLSKIGYVGESDLDYNILMNFILLFVPAILLLPSQAKAIKNGELKFDNKYLLFLFCFIFFVDRCMINITFSIAPNPGYALAINNTTFILITAFKDMFINKVKENNMITVSSVLFLALSMIYFTNL